MLMPTPDPWELRMHLEAGLALMRGQGAAEQLCALPHADQAVTTDAREPPSHGRHAAVVAHRDPHGAGAILISFAPFAFVGARLLQRGRLTKP